MTDTELCLALARAMGHDVELVCKGDSSRGKRNTVVHMQEVSGLRMPTWEFDPINSGADFDAVLMWAINNIRVRASTLNWQNLLWSLRDEPDAAAKRRAVCAAIVEAMK